MSLTAGVECSGEMEAPRLAVLRSIRTGLAVAAEELPSRWLRNTSDARQLPLATAGETGGRPNSSAHRLHFPRRGGRSRHQGVSRVSRSQGSRRPRASSTCLSRVGAHSSRTNLGLTSSAVGAGPPDNAGQIIITACSCLKGFTTNSYLLAWTWD